MGPSCFPHIVNLACKAVLSMLSNMDYAKEPGPEDNYASFFEAISGDPITTLHAAIRVVGNVFNHSFIQLTCTLFRFVLHQFVANILLSL